MRPFHKGFLRFRNPAEGAKEIKHLVDVSKAPEGGFFSLGHIPGHIWRSRPLQSAVWLTNTMRLRNVRVALPACRPEIGSDEEPISGVWVQADLWENCSSSAQFLEAGRGVFRTLPEGPLPDCG